MVATYTTQVNTRRICEQNENQCKLGDNVDCRVLNVDVGEPKAARANPVEALRYE